MLLVLPITNRDPPTSPLGSIIGLIREILENGGADAGSLSEAGLDGGGGVRSRQILPSNPPFTPRWTSFAFHPASMSSPSLIQGRCNRGQGGPGSPPAPLDLDQELKQNPLLQKTMDFELMYHPIF